MKSRLKLLTLFLSILLASGVRAQTPTVLLDLQVRNGKLEDVSDSHHPVVQKNLATREDGAAVVVPAGSVKIVYQPGDPLFQNGPRTWLLRCKLQAEPVEGYTPLVGQWKAAGNERIIALIMKGGQPGALAFHLSPDGRVEKQVIRLLPEPPTRDAWITVVAHYNPGGESGIFVFDDAGKLQSQAKTGSMAPAAVFSAPVDFELNGPATPGGLQVSAVRVWNGVLTPDQIQRAAAAASKK
jgi:hypothetical protein